MRKLCNNAMFREIIKLIFGVIVLLFLHFYYDEVIPEIIGICIGFFFANCISNFFKIIKLKFEEKAKISIEKIN